MIYTVRGGSGSGKSTVVRRVMEGYSMRAPHYLAGRKQPLWYDLRDKRLRPLRVLGHYEAECGGCDTISRNPTDPSERALDFIHRLVREADDAGLDVLFEGVILSTVSGHLLDVIEEGREVVVLNLTSDLETCLRGIAARRWRKTHAGLSREPRASELDEVRETLSETTQRNNRSKLSSAEKTAELLAAAKVPVYDIDRDQAAPFLLKRLRARRATA